MTKPSELWEFCKIRWYELCMTKLVEKLLCFIKYGVIRWHIQYTQQCFFLTPMLEYIIHFSSESHIQAFQVTSCNLYVLIVLRSQWYWTCVISWYKHVVYCEKKKTLWAQYVHIASLNIPDFGTINCLRL